MSKAFKDIKVEYIERNKDIQNIAISFNDGRYGTDVKWININEATDLLQALKEVILMHGHKKDIENI